MTKVIGDLCHSVALSFEMAKKSTSLELRNEPLSGVWVQNPIMASISGAGLEGESDLEGIGFPHERDLDLNTSLINWELILKL